MTAPRVLITRDPAAALPLAELLRGRGCEPCAARLVEAQLPRDTRPLRNLLREATDPAAATWLCVTSATTVAALAAVAESSTWGDALDAARRSPSGSTSSAGGGHGLRIAAVGPATARALAEYGVGVDFMPSITSSAAGMLAEWPEDSGTGSTGHGHRVLLPVSSLASDTLQDGLTARGHSVKRVTAYETVPAPAERPLRPDTESAAGLDEWTSEDARAACASGAVDAVVVTAPSRAAALLDGSTAAGDVAWIAIGAPTARALREHGTDPVTAEQPTPEALAAAVDAALDHRRRGARHDERGRPLEDGRVLPTPPGGASRGAAG